MDCSMFQKHVQPSLLFAVSFYPRLEREVLDVLKLNRKVSVGSLLQ